MVTDVLRLRFAFLVGLFGFASLAMAQPEAESWTSIQLQSMPELPASTIKRTLQRAPKTKLDLTPSFSKPDFGKTPRLALPKIVSPLVRPKTKLVATWDARIEQYANNTSYSRFAVGSRHTFSQATTASSKMRRQPIPAVSIRVARVPAVASAKIVNATTVNRVHTQVEASKKESTESKTVALQSATVNVRAIAERIKSHNYSVASIEQQLDEQDRWDLDSIESAAAQVEQIRRRQSLWSLYWDLLDEKQRSRTRKPLTLERTIERLRERIFEVMVENQVQPERVSSLSPKEAKSRLENLDRRLNGPSSQ